MKKLLGFSVTVVMLSFFAYGQEVSSVNVVGYMRVSVPASNQYTLVGLNFTDLGTNGYMLLSEVVGTNQLRKSNISMNADKVHFYRGGVYETIYQRADGAFWNLSSVPTNPVVLSGTAFWIQGAANASTTNIVILGSVPVNSSVSQVYSAGYQLFCNPYSTDLDVNGTNVDWTAQGATFNNISMNADKIHIWNGSGYEVFYYRNSPRAWTRLSDATTNNVILPVGQGAWYEAKGSFTNLFSKPYNL